MPLPFESVFDELLNRPGLLKLLWLTFFAHRELNDFPEITEQLIGDWDSARWGQHVTITFDDPYHVLKGYLFTLPALDGTFIDRALVHVPGTYKDEGEAWFYTLKHLATIAVTTELEPSL